MKRKVADITPRAADQLLRYDWPGNVRELENAIGRALINVRPGDPAIEPAHVVASGAPIAARVTAPERSRDRESCRRVRGRRAEPAVKEPG